MYAQLNGYNLYCVVPDSLVDLKIALEFGKENVCQLNGYSLYCVVPDSLVVKWIVTAY